MDSLKDEITKASESTNARFKRKKIRSMKRDFDKINEKLKESEKKLESVGPPRGSYGALKLHPPNRNQRIEKKLAEINKKIRRAKKKKNRDALITKREALKAELNWNPGPRLLEEASGRAYRRYRIDGGPRMDPETFFNRIRKSLIELLKRESRTGAVRAQTTTWIRFK